MAPTPQTAVLRTREGQPRRRRRGVSAAVSGHRSHSEELLHAAAAVLAKTAEDFLPAVVAQIAATLRADLVLIGEYLTSDPDHVQPLALWRDGQLVENALYPLADIRHRSCVTVPLVGSKGQDIGVIAALTPYSISETPHVRTVLQLFAGRAAAELQRAITERELIKSEEHLFQVQRVEAIGRLAGNIAHDFNNLLMIIIGYGEILCGTNGPSHELTQIMAAANRGSTLTQQLLAFGRRQVMEVQRLDMNHVVRQVQTMLTRVIGGHVHLTTRLDPALPSVEADPGQFEQVLVNLAINARDAMPDGGTLHISTGVFDVAQAYNQMPPGRYVEITVTDSGSGMAPDILQHIFEPFFTTKGTGGTGLGLASVYGIVKQTGGFIWCRSTPGEGTTFTIYLRPAKGAAIAPQAPDAMTAPVAGGTETVLVVDDERGVRLLLTQILKNRGYTVIPAADAKTALEALSAPDQQIDLVVSDIVMQGMSGTRLVEEIQLRWPTMKLLLVSGYSRGVALPPGSGAGKVPLLGKPFTPKRLEAIVRDILDGVEVRRTPARAPEELPEP